MHRKLALFLFSVAVATLAQTSSPQTTATSSPAPKAAARETGPECDACIRRNLSVLAGPSLHGRGSGTEDEHKAAEYIAKKLKQYGLAPAADGVHERQRLLDPNVYSLASVCRQTAACVQQCSANDHYIPPSFFDTVGPRAPDIYVAVTPLTDSPSNSQLRE